MTPEEVVETLAPLITGQFISVLDANGKETSFIVRDVFRVHRHHFDEEQLEKGWDKEYDVSVRATAYKGWGATGLLIPSTKITGIEVANDNLVRIHHKLGVKEIHVGVGYHHQALPNNQRPD